MDGSQLLASPMPRRNVPSQTSPPAQCVDSISIRTCNGCTDAQAQRLGQAAKGDVLASLDNGCFISPTRDGRGDSSRFATWVVPPQTTSAAASSPSNFGSPGCPSEGTSDEDLAAPAPKRRRRASSCSSRKTTSTPPASRSWPSRAARDPPVP